ncbi:hypothetical protein CGCF415_v002066 [Colletotrichum fructicola]|uniref:BZIP domain-containing protein n=1 Tax=Colletotrichum fructicola (strain Nara gc5) TaxID=1213859 RepID=A0A7J6IXH4_COLFN|nr:uncharacterized protein CGMCC3_g7428 [Colletotrichum fructicola]KAF4482003.1 hypothetical protein CGGC5_v008831 [Colletotrichum fructicola Nara gc5]KAE9576596.1 hypothetical protein CGMCC3_g7428 [Colletotrichum fructicola]KAF4430088.1 hypothetical protein CFRS1_v010964 [Colletotrichum fructicola]KAF4903781.1 hypothetical protein CGCFRS4_v001506 [Colletotrichum fructicola]KAF4914747.1 hypothetical protein CGCF415_v002066 [Colletotrichum fructicola]
MELSDYEARRKVQNREAQRRYMTQPNSSRFSSSIDLHSVVEAHGSLDVDFSDFFQGSSLDLTPGMVSSMAAENNNFDDFSVGEGYSTHHTLPDHDGYHRHASSSSCSAPRSRKHSLPERHDLILTKADRMVHDLDRLYEFGVDMQLITPSGELKTSLANIERLFRKSIHKAAENEYHD